MRVYVCRLRAITPADCRWTRPHPLARTLDTYNNMTAGSDSSAECRCNAGYAGSNGGTCTACVAGKYKTAPGSAACTDCPAGTFSPAAAATASSACSACPALSSSPAGARVCLCRASGPGV